MTDPLRLVDESSDELERALLRAGKNYRASPGARERTLAVLGVAGSATLLGKLASAVGASWGIKAGLTAAGLATAIGAGIYVVETRRSEPVEARTGVAPAPMVERAPEPDITPAPEATPSAPSASAGTDAVGPMPSGVREPSPGTAAPQGTASITAELRAVDAARSALAAGNGTEALRLLDVHARTFPRGRLKLEAEVLRIEAMARTGDSAGAAARARAFLARYPNSVFAPRLERYARR